MPIYFTKHQAITIPDNFPEVTNSNPFVELHQLMDDTALDIALATINTQSWPALIIHLLRALEYQAPTADAFDEALIPIHQCLTKRLNIGNW